MGYYALEKNTTAYCNTAIGTQTLDTVTTGSRNTGLGSNALTALTTAVDNTGLGVNALSSVTTGVQNTGLGRDAGCTITTGANNTNVGYNAQPSAVDSTSQMTLGDANISNLRCNDTSISSLSDLRDKINVEDIPHGLDYILALRPVKFDWNRRDGSSKGKKDYGFIAQELDQVEETFGNKEYTRLVHKENPEKWEADVMKTYPILIKAIQELKAEIELLKNK